MFCEATPATSWIAAVPPAMVALTWATLSQMRGTASEPLKPAPALWIASVGAVAPVAPTVVLTASARALRGAAKQRVIAAAPANPRAAYLKILIVVWLLAALWPRVLFQFVDGALDHFAALFAVAA